MKLVYIIRNKLIQIIYKIKEIIQMACCKQNSTKKN